nr:Mov34/MPN/PAD-1 family protein [Sphingomonas sp.]
MRVRISRCVVELIQRAAREAHPREACGLLFGDADEISHAQVAANVADQPERMFEIDPAALFAALKAERAGGATIVGYWHSHPSGKPAPSARDAEMALADGKLWLIVSSSGMALWRPVEQVVYEWDADRATALAQCGTVIGFDRVPAETGDVRDLLPHDKCDEEMVPLLAEAGYPAVAPYLDDLIVWTFDPNWPIAMPMAEWLSTLGTSIVGPLQRVLRGTDGDGKVNCLSSVARHLEPGLRTQLAGDLRRLAERPSENDRKAKVDACARALLGEWGMAE